MERYFTLEYWKNILHTSTHWLVTDLPSLLFLILLLFIVLRVSSSLINNLKQMLLRRMIFRNREADLENEKRLNTLIGIVHKTARVVIWSIFIMIFLEKININIAPILTGAGIVGLAVGFGAQELVRDFISGFFILLEDGIRTGDVVTLNGTSGKVEKIELRTITLRDSSGVVHIFQNGKINTISNMTKGWSAMVFDISVAYKENLTQVMELMKQVGDEMYAEEQYKHIMLNTMEVSGLNSFGESGLIIRGRIRTKAGQQWGVGREYRKRLKEAFDENNITIPFPHHTIYWGEEIDPLKMAVKVEKYDTV